MHKNWIALINFCTENPNCTIKSLQVQDGAPVFLVREIVLYGDTTAEVKERL